MQSVTAVFWHRELAPIDAEVMAEHTVEANSNRVPGTLDHRTSCGIVATRSSWPMPEAGSLMRSLV
jgi:hypothetical protein